MSSLLPKKHRRHVLDLQLTAMIDIFSLIIIFLIKGTVFGVSDIGVPPGVRLPTSSSKESIETAPTAQIISGNLKLSIVAAQPEVSVSQLEEESNTAIQSLRKDISKYVASLSKEARSSGVLVSIIADRNTPYLDIFKAVKFLRKSGFEGILFIAGEAPGAETKGGGG